MWLQFSVDLVTFTEEVFNGKIHFLCIVELTLVSTVHQKKEKKLSEVDARMCSEKNIS